MFLDQCFYYVLSLRTQGQVVDCQSIRPGLGAKGDVNLGWLLVFSTLLFTSTF